MAGIITNMSKVKQILRLHADGVSNRKIALSLGIYKETVNNYIQKIKNHEYDLDKLLSLEDPELERILFAGNPAYKQERFDEFKEKIPYFEKELKKRHVTRYLLWQEYRRDYPDGYSYSQFCYHLQQSANARKPGSLIHYNPGEKLLVDFAGDTISYIDRETGEVVQTQVFVVTLEEVSFDASRGVSKTQILSLATGSYIRGGESILITGATGCGKSFIATSFGYQACKQGFSVNYFSMQKLMAKIKIARIEGVMMRFFEKLAKTDLLILDDFGIGSMDNQQQQDFMERIEDRHARKATIIASQLPPANWFELFTDETIADAFMDRIIHTSHRIELKGESLRKKR